MNRLLCLAFPLLFVSSVAIAAEYPEKQVRMIVPFPPGAVTDIVARVTADFMRNKFGKAVVVENRAGAGGNMGTREFVKAEPDGYTLGMTANSILAINPHIYKSMPFDPLVDIEPIATIVEVSAVVVVNASAPYRDLRGFLALAKEKPGHLTYGSSGLGSPLHLGMHRLAHMAGVELLHVPYSGASGAIIDLIAGRIDAMALGYGTVVEHVKAGKLKIIAVATSKRLPELPDVPTVAEIIGKDFEHSAWFGLAVAKGTPTAIVDKLQAIVGEMLDDPTVDARLKSAHLMPMRSTPAQFKARIQAEYNIWKALIEDTKVEKQ